MLLTFNIVSLVTNIPHELGLGAVAYYKIQKPNSN